MNNKMTTAGNTQRARQAIESHKREKEKVRGKVSFCPAKVRDKQAAKRGRLPDGSSYICRYDATACLWTVTLAVTTAAGEQTFSHQFGALFQCLEKVDKMYRATLAEKGDGP